MCGHFTHGRPKFCFAHQRLLSFALQIDANLRAVSKRLQESVKLAEFLQF